MTSDETAPRYPLGEIQSARQNVSAPTAAQVTQVALIGTMVPVLSSRSISWGLSVCWLR
jgi:hypothetical protein